MGRYCSLASLLLLTAATMLPAAWSAVSSQSVEIGIQPVGLIGKTSGTGPMPAVAEAVASLRSSTIYRPQRLPEQSLPLLLWGNGGCRDNGLRYSQFLREIASHGFIIVAAGFPRFERALQPPGSTAPPLSAEAVRVDELNTETRQLLEAIDWAMAQNSDPKSAFHQRIDTTRIGVFGTSCGGLQAIAAAADRRIKTAIGFNTGVLSEIPASASSNSSLIVLKDELKKLHAPIAYINGGPTDIAYPNALDDMQRLDQVPVFFAENGVGHGGTYLFDERGGEYSEVAVAWMNWQLKGDKAAARWFQGADCVLCQRTGWAVRKKNFYGE